MRRIGIIGASAALLGLAAAESSRVYGAENIQRVITQAKKNRRYVRMSGTMPHQGKREIARRLRQCARDEDRQRNRAERSVFAQLHDAERLSRRGRIVL